MHGETLENRERDDCKGFQSRERGKRGKEKGVWIRRGGGERDRAAVHRRSTKRRGGYAIRNGGGEDEKRPSEGGTIASVPLQARYGRSLGRKRTSGRVAIKDWRKAASPGWPVKYMLGRKNWVVEGLEKTGSSEGYLILAGGWQKKEREEVFKAAEGQGTDQLGIVA